MERKGFISLKTKLFMVIIGTMALPIFCLGMFFARQNERMNQEKAWMANQYVIGQLGTTLEHFFSSIQQTSLFLYQNEMVRQFLQTSERTEQSHAYIQLNNMVQNELAYEKYIEGVQIQRPDGTYYESSSEYPDNPENTRRLMEVQSGKMVFLGQVRSRFDRERDAYAFARKIYDINDQSSYLGLMQLYIQKNQFQKLLQKESSAVFDNFYLLDDKTVVIASDEGAEGRRMDEIACSSFEWGKKGIEEIRINNQDFLLTYYHLEYPDWYLVNVMSCEEIHSQNRVFVEMLATILTLVVSAAALTAYGLMAAVLNPLKQVAMAMKNLEEENFHLSVPVKGNDETAVLASSFNRMSRRLDKLVNQIHVVQLSEKNAQIKALQAYINPHFLYNTLDVICWMGRMEEAWETCRLVEALSKLFRMSIHMGTKGCLVRDEVEYTKNYLMIQECRFSDRIQFNMKIDPETEECETVSFILQPLIENAITHGLEEEGEGGTVSVEIRREGEELVYVVADDGKQADIEELRHLMTHYQEGKRGMSIASIHDRIRLHYDNDGYGLYFEANDPKGLRAVVRQPFKIRGDNKNASSDDR